MKLPLLKNITGFSIDLRGSIILSQLKNINKKFDNEELNRFNEKWLSAIASLVDWVKIGPINVKEILDSCGLPPKRIKLIFDHQKQLYNLYLEAKLQYVFLRNFNQVLEITPSLILEYVSIQIKSIDDLLLHNIKPSNHAEEYFINLEFGVDYCDLYNKSQQPDYSCSYNIYSSGNMVYLEELLHYKEFLEKFRADPIIECEEKIFDEDDYSMEAVFQETFNHIAYVQFKISNTKSFNDDEEFLDWSINSANESHSPDAYRIKLKSIFRKEYRQLLHRLREFNEDDQELKFLEIAEDLTRMKNTFIFESEYIQSREEANLHQLIPFKRFSKIGFIGSVGFDLVFNQENNSTFRNLLKRAQPFAIAAEESLTSFVQKLEITVNYLDLLRFSMEVAAESMHDPLSFEYKKLNTHLSNITNFYKALKDAGYIDISTNISSFRIVFQGKKVVNPIIWVGKIGELHYMLKLLHSTNAKLKPTGRKFWTIAAHCFRRPGGVVFTSGQLRKAKVPSNPGSLTKICNEL